MKYEGPLYGKIGNKYVKLKQSSEDVAKLHEDLVKMREKWIETRRHLRTANKGAERNAIALQLAVKRHSSNEIHERHMRLMEETRHETILWNWLTMSDEALQKKIGDAVEINEIKACRKLLRAMLNKKTIQY